MVETFGHDGSAFEAPKITIETEPAEQIIEPDLSLEGLDFGHIAEKFANDLDEEDSEWIKAGVDDDGQTLTAYEL